MPTNVSYKSNQVRILNSRDRLGHVDTSAIVGGLIEEYLNVGVVIAVIV